MILLDGMMGAKTFIAYNRGSTDRVLYIHFQCLNLDTVKTLLILCFLQEERNLPEEDDFEQTYIDLVSKRAYRHPHPGAPKGREGCMGGTWRHMKEAIGYGPGRLMWIDGKNGFFICIFMYVLV